jgi:hypothetical protein
LASIINASNSGFGGIVSTGDSSGQLQLQAAGTTVATIQSTGLNLGSNGVVFSDASSQTAAASPYVLKNRIINGDMRIDQRNAGASIATTVDSTETYTLDRWYYRNLVASKYTIQQNAASVTPPAGFTNYLGCTSTSAYTVAAGEFFTIGQNIEGYNISDLDFGKSTAKTITISFWVRSSLTGTFGAVVANNTFNRCYPFTYSISVANTWEQKTITIAGDTTGTWLTTNGTGLSMRFSLGAGSTYNGTAGAWTSSTVLSVAGATSVVGTNGATLYITGVQLEQNTSATPFERRLFNQELANCQRYFEKQYELSTPVGFDFANDQKSSFSGLSGASTLRYSNSIPFKVSKRASPTLAFWDYNGVSGNWMTGAAGQSESTTAVNGSAPNENSFMVYFSTGNNWSYGFWTASAEL